MNTNLLNNLITNELNSFKIFTHSLDYNENENYPNSHMIMAKTSLMFNLNQNLDSPPKSQANRLSLSATENNRRKQIFQFIKVKKDQESSLKVTQENAKKDYNPPQFSCSSDFNITPNYETQEYNSKIDIDQNCSEELTQNPFSLYQISPNRVFIPKKLENNSNFNQNNYEISCSSNYQINPKLNNQNNSHNVNVVDMYMNFSESKSNCSNLFELDKYKFNQFGEEDDDDDINCLTNSNYTTFPQQNFNPFNIFELPCIIHNESSSPKSSILLSPNISKTKSYNDEEVNNAITNTSNQLDINMIKIEIPNDSNQSENKYLRNDQINYTEIENQEDKPIKAKKKYKMLNDQGPEIFNYCNANGEEKTLKKYSAILTRKKLKYLIKKGGCKRKEGGGMKQYVAVDEKLFEYILVCSSTNSLPLKKIQIQKKANEFSYGKLKGAQSWFTKFRQRFEKRFGKDLVTFLAENKK